MKDFTGKLNLTGSIGYYLNGKFHRNDGPALIVKNGLKHYYLYGIFYTRDNWFQQLTREQQVVALMNVENF